MANQNEQDVTYDAADIFEGSWDTSKAKNFKKSFKNLVRYTRKNISLKIFITALIIAVISAVLTLITPRFLTDLTDHITENMFGTIDLSEVALIGFILLGLYASSAVLSFIQGYMMASATQRLTKKLRSDLNLKLQRVPLAFYHQHATGDILSRITNDADMVGQNLNNSLSVLITAIVTLIGTLIMMFITNWIMALTVILSTLIGIVAMFVVMAKTQKYYGQQYQYLGQINGQVEETYSGHVIVKAYNAQKERKKTFSLTNDELKKSSFKAQIASSVIWPMMYLIDNLSYVAIAVVGAILVTNGYISIGVIVGFIFYAAFFTQPLLQIGQNMQGIQSAIAASERIFEFLDAQEMTDESQSIQQISNVAGHVRFEHVKFGYEKDKTIIHDFNATIKPGQKVAIVGPTGAGKTTLVNLLMRFYEIDKGNIFIDDTSIYDMKRSDLRKLFCMVLQDTWIFEGTIHENIAYINDKATKEDVIKASQSVGLHHFIQTLPQGYDTVLNEHTALSEGQKQQITIARAIIQNAPMLILDEATSNVDTRTELHIQQAMDQLMTRRTSFVIAHRLSTIKNADLILVLKAGEIVESGNHQQLINQKGVYAQLYNSQFESTTI